MGNKKVIKNNSNKELKVEKKKLSKESFENIKGLFRAY